MDILFLVVEINTTSYKKKIHWFLWSEKERIFNAYSLLLN